ncbi:MAG: zinc ribbon domain-containing protein, partial [Acidovorax sp.]|nr:zinc ribbon domain-containing protein [Acidovorax sp.]
MSVNCHACATVNRDGAKCCKGCGTALIPQSSEAAASTVCPACAAPCKPGARFCGQCGENLVAPQPAVAVAEA